jgi:hypothetical protein
MIRRLLLAAAALALLATAGDLRAQGGAAEEADGYVAQALQMIRAGDAAGAVPLLEEAERLAGGAPAVQVRLGRAYAEAALPRRAAVVFMKAALNEDQPLAAAAASVELVRLADGLKPPPGFAALLSGGRYAEAIARAPWWPAGYWASAMQAQIDGRRADAFLGLREFLTAMRASGLDKPYREWTIEAEQMRDQVGAVEAGFLADAGVLPADWRARVGGVDADDMARAFGAVDADLWRVAGEAMRYTLRYKTLVVARDGTGEFRSIQAAVDALERSAGGGVVVVEPGDYRETVVVREASRLVLRASRPGTVTVTADGPALSLLGGSQLVVDGIAFRTDGGTEAGTVAGSQAVTLRRCSFSGGTTAALRARDVSDIYLWDVDARSPGVGVSFERATLAAWVKGRVEGAAAGVESASSDVDLAFLTVSGGRDGVAAWGATEGCGGKGGCPTAALSDSVVDGASDAGVSAQAGAYVVVRRSRLSAAGAGVRARDADVEVTDGEVFGPGRFGVAVSGRGATARVDATVLRGLDVGLAAADGASLEAADDAVIDGRIGAQVVASSATIVRPYITGQAEQGLLLSDPTDGWSVSDGEIDASSSAVVLLGGGGSAGGCTAAGGRIERMLFVDDGLGVVAGPSASRGGGAVCVLNATFVGARRAGVWAAAGGPRVLVSRSILAYGGAGLLDPAGLIEVSDSAAFSNWAGDSVPAGTRPGLRHQDPLFLDVAGEDWRLAGGSPAAGLGAGRD